MKVYIVWNTADEEYKWIIGVYAKEEAAKAAAAEGPYSVWEEVEVIDS